MEPMTLGSPTGNSPPNTYLPSFLMGEQQAPTPLRNNTLSPAGGRNVSFATSPANVTPQDYNRSVLGQKTLFGGYQQMTSPGTQNMPGTPLQTNKNTQGPPTKGLFDTLQQEQNQITSTSPLRQMQAQTQFGSPLANPNLSSYGMNSTFQQQLQPSEAYNDPCFNTLSYNSPLSTMSSNSCTTPMLPYSPTTRYREFWVTVFGFPPSAVSLILSHFSQCGTIVDKISAPQNGNWIHLKFSSRTESDRALNFNERILGNHIMIGVTHCKDKNIVDKENLSESATESQSYKIRPLAQIAMQNAQNDSSVVSSPCAPQKSTRLVDKAMDFFFGW